jgi:NitT/TauT family transport system substrate-binding protein
MIRESVYPKARHRLLRSTKGVHRLGIGVVALALVSACSSSSPSTSSASQSSQSKNYVTVDYGYIPSAAGPALPAYLAQELGIFKKFGLNVQFVPVGTGGASLAEMENGDVNVLLQGVQFVASAATAGLSLRMFCGAFSSNQSGLVERSKGTLATGSADAVLRSLKGKTVALSSVGAASNNQDMLEGALEAAGVDPNSVNYIAASSYAAADVALRTGAADAAVGFPFLTDQLIAAGYPLALNLTKEIPSIYGILSSEWVAPTSWIKDNGATAKQFCSAMNSAYKAFDDPANAANVDNLLASKVGLDKATIAVIHKEGLANSFYPTSTSLPQAAVAQSIAFYGKVGLLTGIKNPSYDSFVLIP